MKHHDDAIARYVARVSLDTDVLGVVITGSLVRGTEKPTSDVDLYLVVTEEAWDAAFANRRLMFIETEGADYEGGYFDIKLATLSYLDDAAERGDDPVRDSFAHSRIVFSRVDDLAERVLRASVVPDDEWDARVRSFIAQVRLHGGYFLGQAVASGDPVLISHASVHLAFAASRAVLAANRVLFQGPKYLAKSIASVEARPDGFDELIVRLLEDRTVEAGHDVRDAIEAFAGAQLVHDETLSTFVLDNELAWRYRSKTPEYS